MFLKLSSNGVENLPGMRLTACVRGELVTTLAVPGVMLCGASRILGAATTQARMMKAAESPDIKIITANVSEGGLEEA